MSPANNEPSTQKYRKEKVVELRILSDPRTYPIRSTAVSLLSPSSTMRRLDLGKLHPRQPRLTIYQNPLPSRYALRRLRSPHLHRHGPSTASGATSQLSATNETRPPTRWPPSKTPWHEPPSTAGPTSLSRQSTTGPSSNGWRF